MATIQPTTLLLRTTHFEIAKPFSCVFHLIITTILQGRQGLSFPGSKCQDRVRRARDLFGEMPVKDTGKREKSGQEKPSDHKVGLTPMKGERKGRKFG